MTVDKILNEIGRK